MNSSYGHIIIVKSDVSLLCACCCYSDVGQEYTNHVPVSSGRTGYHLVQLDGTDSLVNDYIHDSQLPFQPDHVHAVVMPSGHRSMEYRSMSGSGGDEERRARAAIQVRNMCSDRLF